MFVHYPLARPRKRCYRLLSRHLVYRLCNSLSTLFTSLFLTLPNNLFIVVLSSLISLICHNLNESAQLIFRSHGSNLYDLQYSMFYSSKMLTRPESAEGKEITEHCAQE